MAYSFEQTKKGYASLWDAATIMPAHVADAQKVAAGIVAKKGAFIAVQNATGVPWPMVGAMLYRESNLDLNTYLGNGQSLHQVTTIVPKGRGPFATFQDGAVDALTLQGMTGIAPADWTIERVLYWLERFNGQGYFNRGNSPYLWSWTDQYHGGKFVRDGVYDSNTWDAQGGCVAILKTLELQGVIR